MLKHECTDVKPAATRCHVVQGIVQVAKWWPFHRRCVF